MAKKRSKKRGAGGLLAAILEFVGFVFFKLLPLVILIAIMVFIGWGVKEILYSDAHFKVQEVKVLPPNVLSTQSIQALEAKIVGRNILTIDLKNIAALLEVNQEIQTAKVVREMPSTVRIEIKRRQPVAFVQFKSNGPFAIAAEDGYILEIASRADGSMVVIENYGDVIRDPKIGSRVANKGYREALRFLENFKKNKMSRQEGITRLSLDYLGNVTVTLGGGPDFRLGRKPSDRLNFMEKAMYLFQTEDRANVEYLDLQYDRVIVKRKK